MQEFRMRIGVLLLVIGLGFVLIGAAGYSLGHAWVLAASLWPATSFLVVAAGYAGVGARVFAKRPDGSLPGLVLVLLLPYFAFTWGLWSLLRLNGERCWDRVAPGVYLGRRAFAHELPADVSLIVDMTAEFPRPRSTSQSYRCLPTLDGFIPEEVQCKALVDDLAAHPAPVYIHCAQGHGRSAVVAGALLVKRGLAGNASEAEALLKRARPGVSLSRHQRQLLQSLCSA
jgi:protein-tyrosine phosphatase